VSPIVRDRQVEETRDPIVGPSCGRPQLRPGAEEPTHLSREYWILATASGQVPLRATDSSGSCLGEATVVSPPLAQQQRLANDSTNRVRLLSGGPVEPHGGH
jgi:hypothetical protein